MTRVSFACTLALAAFLGCSQDLGLGPAAPTIPDGQPLAVNATVVYSSLEGGCWALVTSNGHYGPLSMPVAFHVNGLRVRAVLRSAPGSVSICEPLPLVHVDSISRR